MLPKRVVRQPFFDMATVTLTFTDDGRDADGKPNVGVIAESTPAYPLRADGTPDIEMMTAAQVSAWGTVIGLSEEAVASRVFTQDGDTVTELTNPKQWRST
jgi:hypothetical protein